MRMGTQGSSPRNYKQNRVTSPRARGGRGPWIIPGQAVWWLQNQSGHTVTDTAWWWHCIDGVKGGQTGRVEGELLNCRHGGGLLVGEC